MEHTILWKRMKYGRDEEGVECCVAVLLVSFCAAETAKGILMVRKNYNDYNRIIYQYCDFHCGRCSKWIWCIQVLGKEVG